MVEKKTKHIFFLTLLLLISRRIFDKIYYYISEFSSPTGTQVGVNVAELSPTRVTMVMMIVCCFLAIKVTPLFDNNCTTLIFFITYLARGTP